jgi:hypothetical protein
MKRIFSFLCIVMFLMVMQVSSVWAATFTVSATLNAATGVAITVSSVNATSKAFTTLTGTALSFNPLTFNTANSIWLPDHFFAVDVAPAGGGGSVDATVSYAEGTNPNTATTGHGLGWKSTATFVKVVGTTETVLSAHGKKMLKDLSGEHITSTETAGGYLRTYVGIVAKDPAAVPLDPATSEPFTNVDVAGAYNGTLTVTATAV